MKPATVAMLCSSRDSAFFLRQRRHLVEYIPNSGCEDKTLKKIEKEQGYLLVFTVVRGDGLHTDLYNMY